ncbi:MAG: putative zinc-binding metallopeptidase [Dysgonamonadaceae bacterium]|jgi:substrate import-associated zinc metallohydrolase lipoprotein|nr:putative zinc-binding metallopeptidase [Dysgonamonadaceae bacterium]
MKKIIFALCIATGLFFSSCDNEPALDENSIFDTEAPLRNDFDKWLITNYVYPYNVEFKYRLEDIESSQSHTLAPAEYSKSIAMAKLVKYLWFEAYDEIRGIDFLRNYAPRMIHLVGSGAYNSEGTVILGTAEGGMKVTLYMVNNLDPDNVSMDFLNYYYFKTMHHEFCHILHQTVRYDPNFQLISEASYVSGDWYLISSSTAHKAGFVSPYAMNAPDEDFVETYAVFLTSTPASWEALLADAGTTGRPIIEQKYDIMQKYLSKTWGIDVVALRDIIQRRSQEMILLDLEHLN